MIRGLIAGVGKILLLLATLAFVIFLSLFVATSFFLTWPILRLSPRDRKIKAMMNLAQSVMTALSVFSEDNVKRMMAEALEETEEEPPDDEEPEIYVSDWSTH